MILVDTSLWVHHLRADHAGLAHLLEEGSVLGHPWIVGELALGNLSRDSTAFRLLDGLPQARVASHDEMMILIDSGGLRGLGIGYVDAQLLAATRLTPDATLWTADQRLATAAAMLGCAAADPQR